MPAFQRIRYAGWHWLGLVVVLSLLLAACGAPAQPAAAPAGQATEAAGAEAAPAAGEVSRAETLIHSADFSDWLSLDPAVAYEFGGIQAVGNMYETLVTFIPGQEGVQPLLAESWDVKDDGDVWTVTFKLNPNAKFASGNPVTADDVVYSWGRVLDLNLSPAFLFIDIAQITKESVTAVDPQTVELKLPKAVSPQVALAVLSFSVGAVVEKAVVEANAGDDQGSAWLNDNSAGSGPYILDKWDRNSSIVLDANPAYWGAAPAMKRIILQNTAEAANRQAGIETGDADIAQDLGPEQVVALEGNPDLALDTVQSSLLVYVGMNANKAPTNDPKVRQAIRYAVNYDEVEQLLAGSGTIVQEIIPVGYLGHTGNNPFSQDIEKAKALLAEAGVAEGTELEILVPTSTAPGGVEWSVIAAKLQSDLAKAGLTLNIKQLQQSELLNIYRAQDGQLVMINWGPDFPDPDGNATPFSNYDAQSLAWRNDWNDPQAIELSKQAAVELDTAKRVELYAQLTDYVQQNGPYVMLYQPNRTFGVRNDIQGFVYSPVATPQINYAAITRQ
jgi:peptide/nickel transport system substrate-binding protein